MNELFVKLAVMHRNFFERLASKKHKGVDGLIVAIILVVIVVGLLVAFRTAVIGPMNNQIGSMSAAITSLGTAP